jgi:hypothetical protein
MARQVSSFTGLCALLLALCMVGSKAFTSTAPTKVLANQQVGNSPRRIFSTDVALLRMRDNDDSEDKDKAEEPITDAPAPRAETSMDREQRRKDIMDNNPDRVNETLGLGRGAVLLGLVLLINTWFFTIPPEFRRTRLCNEWDTAQYPELCMTPKGFVNGISEYYKNGTW